MTRADFELIARTIRSLRGMPAFRPDDADLVAVTFARVLERTNPRFDGERFLQACGLRTVEEVLV